MARQARTEDLPTAIVRAQGRFGRWRSSRRSRTERIPEALWKLAVKVARQQGTWRTARALRLDSGTLKRRMEANSAEDRRAQTPEPVTRFVELVPPETGMRADCLVEVEASSGARLRLRLQGIDGAALGALARAFVEVQGTWSRSRPTCASSSLSSPSTSGEESMASRASAARSSVSFRQRWLTPRPRGTPGR